jgi:SAM-dependent methyltransferase
MFADVVELREFYGTRLGQVARRMVARRIRQLWPDITGMRLLGLGYATPYLRPFLGEAERVLALMPAAQGVLHWPPEGPNRVVLTDEGELPLADFSVDRVLLIHGIEFSEQIRPMLKEAWRVLAGGGRLLAVLPNRRGIWARIDNTPFGQGHPYTTSQLSRLLREESFTPERNGGALYVPPTRSRMMLRSAVAWEGIGERWFNTFGGVVMVEAVKEISTRPVAVRKPRTRRVLLPMPGTPSPVGR